MSSRAAPPAAAPDLSALRRALDPSRAPVLGALVAALVATGVVLSGLGGPGLRLVRDFVGVPAPAAPQSWLPATASALRAWPLDAVTWAVSHVVPVSVQQVALLAVSLLGAGAGAGLLVRRAGTAAAAAAAWVAIWNPYVAERLLLGQVPTLLGYACLPWILLVGRSHLPPARRLALLFVVALPAALTPWGGVVAAVTALGVEVSRPDRTPARTLLVGALGLLWCSPWLVPALLAGGVPADPDGPLAFALADDSGLGTWGSAVTGGGIWASGARPGSRSDPLAVTASVVLVGLAVVGAVLVIRAARRREGARRGPVAAAVLALVALLAVPTVGWWASGPGSDVAVALQRLPGAALVRDQHRMLAPAVLALAVLVGLLVGQAARAGGTVAGALACLLVVSLAVASVPDLVRSLRSAYRPVVFPAEWGQVVGALGTGGRSPTVLSLPWQPLRVARWAGGPPFLDPLPRAVPGTVLVSTALSVRRDGQVLVVDDTPVDEAWATGAVSAPSLRRHGVTHVVEWLGTPGALASSREGWRVVHEGADFRVWDVTEAR